MKLMLLADLHLGKKVNEFSLIEDQAFILDQIIESMDRHRPDGVVIAGDVYDKSAPSAEAVRLLDNFICRIAQRDIRLFMISGNHDSADRLSFGSRIFSSNHIFIAESFRQPIEPITWQVGEVTADIYLLPFTKPVQVRSVWPESDVSGYDEAIAQIVSQINLNSDRFNLLVAHQFITGAKTFDSDDILIGGIDQVRADHFTNFDLVVLGHLHGPQTVGRESIRYPGSPLKYSFSEAGHVKSVPLITISSDHTIETELLPLQPLRDLRVVRGPFEMITQPEIFQVGNQQDYVQITLTDEFEIPDVMAKCRAIYPNLMKLNYDNQRTKAGQAFQTSQEVHHKSPLELFQDFYHQQNNRSLTDEQTDYVMDLLQTIGEEI
jgi:exonuclease SbcD